MTAQAAGPARPGDLFGDAQLALVEQIEREIDRVADLAGRRARDSAAVLESRIDDFFEVLALHDCLQLVSDIAP